MISPTDVTRHGTDIVKIVTTVSLCTQELGHNYLCFDVFSRVLNLIG